MKDSRKLSSVVEDLYLIASYFCLSLNYRADFHLAKEMEYDMNMKIKNLLHVAL